MQKMKINMNINNYAENLNKVNKNTIADIKNKAIELIKETYNTLSQNLKQITAALKDIEEQEKKITDITSKFNEIQQDNQPNEDNNLGNNLIADITCCSVSNGNFLSSGIPKSESFKLDLLFSSIGNIIYPPKY